MSSQKLTGKQYAKIPLFWNVRQINGEKAFKIICESAVITHYTAKTQGVTANLDKKFIYVKEGEILVYKIDKKNSSNRSLIRTYKGTEFCGFQDYPLFWSERIAIEISPRTTLITLPLSSFYRLFRRVVPMNYLQSKAEYLKKLGIFKSVQLQKIFKIACTSHKYRVETGQIIAEQRDQLSFLLIIFSGKFELRSQFIEQPIICCQNEIIFAKQINQGINCCFFRIECLIEGDIIAVPKQQYLNVVDIRYKLANQETIPHKQEIQVKEEKRQQEIKDFKNKTMYTKSIHRPKTESKQFAQNSFHNTVYTNFEKLRCNTIPNSEQSDPIKDTKTIRPLSRGEIQLKKYIQRKDRIQTTNFLRYVESRAPQIIINPSKQFSVLKPFYKSKSLYIKNMKRKMKKSANYNQKSLIHCFQTSKSINFDN